MTDTPERMYDLEVMNKGYIVLDFLCPTCQETQPHRRVARFSLEKKIVRGKKGSFQIRPSDRQPENIPEDAVKVRATCMICSTRSAFVTTLAYWQTGYHTVDDLCDCGLPSGHERAHLGVSA